MSKISILKELWEFIKHHKKYWLIPIIVILLLIGILLVITEGSAIAPFIYTLF
jgi:competence protein ComGC